MEIDYRYQLKPSSHRLEKKKEKEKRERERERERDRVRVEELQARYEAKQKLIQMREMKI